MATASTSNSISCRWDWCRSSFASIDALDAHVKHDHIWPMKPMRKADVALMRRMDLQSLHSSQDTDSSVISTGLIVGVSRNETSPPAVSPPSTTKKRPENGMFDTFTQLSSPPQAHSPQRLPASPALERLMRQDGRSELSAAVETFERAYSHKANQYLRLPAHQHSPTQRPLSESSGSSQEVIEQHLTQEDDVLSLPRPPSERQIENELFGAELIWPPDDELDAVTIERISNSEQSLPKQNHHRDTSPGSARGRSFHRTSLSVPLGVKGHIASPYTSQESHSPSQPIVLQTQAPYSSQATGWSETQ